MHKKGYYRAEDVIIKATFFYDLQEQGFANNQPDASRLGDASAFRQLCSTAE